MTPRVAPPRRLDPRRAHPPRAAVAARAPARNSARAARAAKKKPLAIVSSEPSQLASSSCSRRRRHERSAGREDERVEAAECRGAVGDEASRPGAAALTSPVTAAASGAPAARSAATCASAARPGPARGDAHRRAVRGEVERERPPKAAHAADHQDPRAGDVHEDAPSCRLPEVGVQLGGDRGDRLAARARVWPRRGPCSTRP